MKMFEMEKNWRTFALFTACGSSLVHAQPGPDNSPPNVSIVWPQGGDWFSAGILIKIKAEATDPDGSIAQVQFFADDNLIGVATNPPFNLIWAVDLRDAPDGAWNLKAVAVDNLGATTESTPVLVYYVTGLGPETVLKILSPLDGAVFAAPATFTFSAEILATEGETGPVELVMGTNSIGHFDQSGAFSATTPPVSVTVSNLLEGEYKLRALYLAGNSNACRCNRITNTVQVVKLRVQSPSVMPDGRLQFDVVTAFPGKPTVIEASPNLLDWVPISTNQPSSNTFTFTESSPATNSQRFYRVFVPP